MNREILLSAFAMSSITHQSPGLWRHPSDQSLNYKSLSFWVDLAKLLERYHFDTIFLADSLSVYQIYGRSLDPALRYGVQIPRLDPFLALSAMAHETRYLGFGVTSNAIFEPPYQFARRISTLDHFTNGRIGWNVVTGHSVYGAKATGQGKLIGHDERYDRAEEYLTLLYRLWEDSWEDGSVLADRRSGNYVDPAKVHRIVHEGENIRLEGIHLVEPSLQRTPVIFQAGASDRGRRFAALHAEVVFVAAPSAPALAPLIADIRSEAGRQRRETGDIRFLAKATVIVARSSEEAQAKLADYKKYLNVEAALVTFSGQTGIDFSGYGLDEVVRHQAQSEGIMSMLEAFTIGDPGREWKLRELAEKIALGGSGPVFVGSPGEVADSIERFLEESGADGLNLTYAVVPGDFQAFGELVVPELRRRGRFKADYRGGTLREKIFGRGARLPPTHPARRNVD